MKKMISLVLVLVLSLSMVSTAFAKTKYEDGKNQYLILAVDDTGATYVSVVGYKYAVRTIKAGKVFEIYLMESERLVPLKFEVVDNNVILTSTVTDEVLSD